MKKLLALMIAAIIAVAAAGCGMTSDVKLVDKDKSSFTVAVLQVNTHTALDAARNGFKDRLNEWASDNGKTIIFDENNALGKSASETSMADKIVAAQPDIMLGISTSSARALAGSTTKIPLLYTAVTDPDGSGISGKNVTGTSDMAPIARQIDLVRTVSPDCRKIALVYHASEENSEKQIKIAEERCAAIGLATKKYAIPDVNSITTTASEIRNAGDIDAVYVPTDNMLASNIAAFCDELYGDKNSTAKIPVIAGEDGLCEDGEALATLGISYYGLGVQTAGMAIKLLCGESPENIAWEYYDRECNVFVNETNAKKLGFTDEKIAEIKNFA